jgi:hypothetical protein
LKDRSILPTAAFRFFFAIPKMGARIRGGCSRGESLWLMNAPE